MSDRETSAAEKIILASTAYIARDGEELGEFKRHEIEERARSGELRPNDYYWQDGMEKWLRLDQVLAPEAWEPLPAAPAEPPQRAAPVAERNPEPAVEISREPEPRTATQSDRPPFTILREAVAQFIEAELTPELKNRLILVGILAGAFLLVILVATFLITRRDGAPPVRPKAATRANSLAGSADPAKEKELSENAAADLRAKIDRLPANAEPPLNTFYYDVSGDMRRSVAPRVLFEAVVRGAENVVDPQSQQTVRRTEFTLVAHYRDSGWFLKEYHGTTHNFAENTDSVEEADEKTLTLPLVATLLGLKIERAEQLSIAPR